MLREIVVDRGGIPVEVDEVVAGEIFGEVPISQASLIRAIPLHNINPGLSKFGGPDFSIGGDSTSLNPTV